MTDHSFTARDTRNTAAETGLVNYLHTVVFSFHERLTPSERAAAIASILTQAEAPGMESMVLAPNLVRQSDPSAWGWALMLDFATEHRSVAFQASTLHQKQIKAGFEPNRTGFVMLDLHQPFDRKTADTGGNEIRHSVMFNFRKDVSEEEQERILATIRQETDQAGVSTVITGKNAFSGSVKPKVSFLEFQIIREFTTEAAWKNFEQSPAHQAFLRDVFFPALDGDPIVFAIRMSGPDFYTVQQIVPR